MSKLNLIEELELIEFFEIETEKLDTDIPFFYNQNKYVKTNGEEQLELIISPSNGIIEVFFYLKEELRVYRKIEGFKTFVVNHDEEYDFIQIGFEKEDIEDVLIWHKPYFKIIH